MPKGNKPAVAPKWAWHDRTLLRLRNNLQKGSEEKLQELAEAIEPHSMHPGDSGTDEFDHDLALALLTREGNALTDVNHAISRIEHGTYGVCEATGVRIPAGRLRALPWCRYARAPGEKLEEKGTVRTIKIPSVVSIRGPQPSIPVKGKSSGDYPEDTAETEEESAEEELGEEISTPTDEEVESARAEEAPATRPLARKMTKAKPRARSKKPACPHFSDPRRR